MSEIDQVLGKDHTHKKYPKNERGEIHPKKRDRNLRVCLVMKCWRNPIFQKLMMLSSVLKRRNFKSCHIYKYELVYACKPMQQIGSWCFFCQELSKTMKLLSSLYCIPLFFSNQSFWLLFSTGDLKITGSLSLL